MSMFTITLIYIFFINQGESSKCSYNSYGDVMKLNPTGASQNTASSDNLNYHGVLASQAMITADLDMLQNMKECYEDVGQQNCIHPAVIAAIASRATRGGSLIKNNAGWGDYNFNRCGGYCAYGILQCDIQTSGLGRAGCTKYNWDSCEHLNMMVESVLVKKLEDVHDKHKGKHDWPMEKLLQGGIAAYNFGVSNVKNPDYRLDLGTTHDDYSNDVTARAQHLIRKYKWGFTMPSTVPSTPSSCQNLTSLANAGDCNFYSCVEKLYPCGEKGYSDGYAQHFCNRFSEHKTLFTAKAQLWLENVRKCLMVELMHYLQNIDKSCTTVMEHAFSHHPTCYVNDESSVCVAILETGNLEGFSKVFDPRLLGEDADYVLQQLIETTRSCSHQYLASVTQHTSESIDDINGKIQSFVSTMQDLIRTEPQDAKKDTSDQCSAYAEDGDCRFYECMHQRFPCESMLGVSHLIHFELVSCKRLKTNGFIFGRETQEFSTFYHICLMNVLLDYYTNSDVNCLEIVDVLHSVRRECLYQTGICAVSNVELLFDNTNNLNGYPYLIPDQHEYQSLDGQQYTSIPLHYYRHTSIFQNQIADSLCRCRIGPDGVCQSKLTLVQDEDSDIKFYVENIKSTNTDWLNGDQFGCADLGGYCSLNSHQCAGYYVPSLCGGGLNTQCCIKVKGDLDSQPCNKEERDGHMGHCVPDNCCEDHFISSPALCPDYPANFKCCFKGYKCNSECKQYSLEECSCPEVDKDCNAIEESDIRKCDKDKTKFYALNGGNEFQLITYDNVNSSYLERGSMLRFVIHGWKQNAFSQAIVQLGKELYKNGDAVILVDWSVCSAYGRTNLLTYFQSCYSTSDIGDTVADFIRGLEKRSYKLDKIHVIGFSLGGKVSARTGYSLGGKLARITGLDVPLYCSHMFGRILFNGPQLRPSRAQFVDTIMTTYLSGLDMQRQGHADFHVRCKTCICYLGKITLDVENQHEEAVILFRNTINEENGCHIPVTRKHFCPKGLPFFSPVRVMVSFFWKTSNNNLGFSAIKPPSTSKYLVPSKDIPDKCFS